MKVNYIFFILIFFVLQNCGYTPMYSNLKSQNYQINIIDIKGNDEMNKVVNLQINKYSNLAIKSLELFDGKDKDMLVELTKLCTQRTR